MKKLLATLMFFCTVSSAFAVDILKVYNFPVRLHEYPVQATLTVNETQGTWTCHLAGTSGLRGGTVATSTANITVSGTYADANGQRDFFTPFANLHIIYTHVGDTLTYLRATPDYVNMPPTPLNPG